jgi:hypothetical protein
MVGPHVVRRDGGVDRQRRRAALHNSRGALGTRTSRRAARVAEAIRRTSTRPAALLVDGRCRPDDGEVPEKAAPKRRDDAADVFRGM